MHLALEVGPSLGSSSKFEPDFRLEVNKLKARARSSLIFQSSIELFLAKLQVKSEKFSNFSYNLLGSTKLECIFSQARVELSPSLGSSSKPGLDFRIEVNKTKARARSSFFLAKLQVLS